MTVNYFERILWKVLFLCYSKLGQGWFSSVCLEYSVIIKIHNIFLDDICMLPWRRRWHPATVLLPGKSHGWRSLVGCSSWVAKSRTRLSDFTFTFHYHALEKEMATHSSVLAWRIPGTGEPCGLLSMGSHRVRHDWSNLAAAAADATWLQQGIFSLKRREYSSQAVFQSLFYHL